MLPSKSDQVTNPPHEGNPNPDKAGLGQEAGVCAAKSNGKLDGGQATDHGLTPDEAMAFDELTKQLTQCLIKKIDGNSNEVEEEEEEDCEENGEKPKEMKTETETEAEAIVQSECQPLKPKSPKRKTYSLKRNLALLDSKGLSGNYWNQDSEGRAQDGRPKRAKAGAKMLLLVNKNQKLEKKLKRRERIASQATISIPGPSKMKLINGIGGKSTEISNQEPAAVAHLDWKNKLHLATVIATALCIPKAHNPKSAFKIQGILAECKGNQARNSRILGLTCESQMWKPSSWNCGYMGLRELLLRPPIFHSVPTFSKNGLIYMDFNRSKVAPPDPMAVEHEQKYFATFGVQPNSIARHVFYFHFGQLGIFVRMLPCQALEISLPTNLKIVDRFQQPSGANGAAAFDGQVRKLHEIEGASTPGSAMAPQSGKHGILLNHEGLLIAFLNWSSIQNNGNPSLLGCCLSNDTGTVYPWLTLPVQPEDSQMEWLFYELPVDLVNMSGIWLLEIGAMLVVSNLLNACKGSGSNAVIHHKFSFCHQPNLKGPNYVTVVPTLPNLIIYGPIHKDCVIKNRKLTQDYFNWVSSKNQDGHGLISVKRSVFSTFAM